MSAIDTLKALGFEHEMTGGGCFALSYYHPVTDARILATASDGNGYPDLDDWMVGVYPSDWDGSQCAYFCSDTGDLSLEQAVARAVEIAGRFVVTEASLTEEYADWLEGQGLPVGDALELLMTADLSAGQRTYLTRFCERWDACLGA
jgi:hypothetical protein